MSDASKILANKNKYLVSFPGTNMTSKYVDAKNEYDVEKKIGATRNIIDVEKVDQHLPSKSDFEDYERVRESGRTNMFDVKNVEMLSGLPRDRIIAVMKNYDKLSKQYPNIRKG